MDDGLGFKHSNCYQVELPLTLWVVGGNMYGDLLSCLLQGQRSEREDDLNSKLTTYLQKLEDMTHQLNSLNSKVQECDDNKVRRRCGTGGGDGTEKKVGGQVWRGK